jgi:hypothetical protein
VLREHDVAGGANIGLIDLTARYALSNGFHVIVEGILRADHYGAMLAALRADHHDRAACFYLHVPFEETLRRHASKPQAADYGAAEMRSWYRELDLLPGGTERVIGPDSTLEATARQVMAEAGLGPAGGR